MLIFDFIKRVITHILDKYFKMVRYYNWLSTRTRNQFLPMIYEMLQQVVAKALSLSWQALFIRNFDKDPLQCPCEKKGRFVGCQAVHGPFNKPVGIAFSPNYQKIFVTNKGNGTIVSCSVDGTGDIGTCKIVGSGFDSLEGIELNALGIRAFFSDIQPGIISRVKTYKINADDTFSECKEMVAGAHNHPITLALNLADT